KKAYQYKTVNLQNQKIDDAIDDLQFDKCRLSIKPTVNNEDLLKNAKNTAKDKINSTNKPELSEEIVNVITIDYDDKENNVVNCNDVESPIKNVVVNTSVHAAPDIVRGVGYAEDGRASHGAKMEELQLKQKLMEEQNKKRKEMLAKALDDRTRQTEEEVMKLDKIKKELQVLDGQKHYLKVEKEFLQAKIQLQKEKDKKELLTEHLCALITHNETRKAQKLETLMLELATNKAGNLEPATNKTEEMDELGDSRVIVDGVDQRTGKMVEFNGDS
ncbi:putative RAB6-interacting golgin-like protein, partial [Operophtera brumata]